MKNYHLLQEYVKLLITEGGAAGHLLHPYEDEDMTLGELKELLGTAAKGELEGATEKLDGLNIVFSWSPDIGLVAARNAGDLKKSSPVPWKEMAARFADRPGLAEAFDGGLEVLSNGIGSMSGEAREVSFGNAKIWYSAEIIYINNPNVIQYSKNAVVVHETPVWEKDESGVPKSLSPDDAAVVSAPFRSAIAGSAGRSDKEGWSLLAPIIANLRALSDGRALDKATHELDMTFNRFGLGDSDKIADYLHAFAKDKVSKYGFDEKLSDAIADRLVVGSPDLRTLKKMAGKEREKDVDSAVKENTNIFGDATRPLAKIVGSYAAALLSGLSSALVDDSGKEVARLKSALDKAITDLKSSEDSKAIEFVGSQLERLQDGGPLTAASEGIVFAWKDKVYKFTGSFAAVNQILGYAKYGRGGKAQTQAKAEATAEATNEVRRIVRDVLKQIL